MTKQIKIVHVDDQQETLDGFKKLVSERDDIEYVHGFTDPMDACQYLIRQKGNIDIVFLDVEMEEKNGLWMAEQLKMLPINIIFLTSHTQYTMQAFEVCAMDYIIKPATMRALNDVLLRYQIRKLKNYEVQKQQLDEFYNQYVLAKQLPKRIFVSTIGEIIIVPVDKIVYFEASENYTILHEEDGKKHMSSKRISFYEELLSVHSDFVRIHRCYIINKNFIASILRDSHRARFAAIMTNGETLEISYKKRDEIIEKLES